MTSRAHIYTGAYYAKHWQGSERSARVVVPMLLDLVHPASVVDVGCGMGIWLAVFREYGVRSILGLDGAHIDRRRLAIPEECFLAADLEDPPDIDRTFDLAMSLEVAEHLPADRAVSFVAFLTRLAPVVVFSAAIPSQGGELHVNEQWPEYWAELFSHHRFVVADCLRRRLWKDGSVDWWYAQNMLVFVREQDVPGYPALNTELQRGLVGPLSIVHPERYRELHEALADESRAYAATMRALLGAGRFEAAVAVSRSIEQYMEELLQDGEWLYLTAFSLHQAETRLSEALQRYDRALEYGFDEFWVRYNRGDLHRRLGHLGQAREDLRRAVELQPGHEGAWQLLGRLTGGEPSTEHA